MRHLMDRVNSSKRAYWRDIPKVPGVYAVVMAEGTILKLSSESGSAKFAIPIEQDELEGKWHRIMKSGEDTDILYIGESKNLRKRVSQLVRFGKGIGKNHRGGQCLWQVNEIEQTSVVLWCCAENLTKKMEYTLLCRFFSQHNELPLANQY